MKWSVVILVLVGLIAAVAAAVLAGSLKIGAHAAAPASDEEVTVLCATRDLPAMMVVDSSYLVQRKVQRSQVPEDFLGDASKVAGQMLAMEIKADQPFTKRHFGRKDASALAEAVKQGKRGFTLSLSPEAAMMNLIMPGSSVDVLASIDVPAQNGKDRESISVTVLQGVYVLAVNDKTVMTEHEGKTASSGITGGHVLLTLLVSPKEAELLELVRSKGQISLSMRNPLEAKSAGDGSVTSLSQITDMYQRRAMPPVAVVETSTPATPNKPQWSVMIYHGAGSAERQTFEMPLPAK